jgi:hypothetical protein
MKSSSVRATLWQVTALLEIAVAEENLSLRRHNPMECQRASRLRNIALVSISREIRVLAKRREPSSKFTPKGEYVTLLRRQSDDARKALHDHMSKCTECRGLDPVVEELAPAQQASD